MDSIDELISSSSSSLTTIIFSAMVIYLIFLLKRFIFQSCRCDICHSYLTKSWTRDFDNLSDWYSHLLKSSPTFTIHIHVLNNTITANPINVEHILKAKFENYPKGKQFSSILGDLLGQGIFNVDGDMWKFQRKIASLELGRVSMRTFAFRVISDEVHSRLLPLLSSAHRDRSVLDLQDVFRRFSFDTICKLSFGLDPGCLELSMPMSRFAMAFDEASRLSAERALTPSPWVWKIKRHLNIGTERKLRDSIEILNRLAEELIDFRRRFHISSENNDLLSRFMTALSEDDKYLRDIVISFLLAGRDTVASALTSFFWLVTQHQNVLSKISDELDGITGEETVIAYDQMREMHYLNAALYESLRLYPPVQFDSKFALSDDVLADGTSIRKSTRVTYHPYAMGRMKSVWGPDCDEFKPERWLKDGKFSPESPYKYPVFQAGIRVCLGKEIALLEMKCVAVALIKRFEIRPVGQYRPVPRFAPGLTATLKDGLPVKVQEKDRWSRI